MNAGTDSARAENFFCSARAGFESAHCGYETRGSQAKCMLLETAFQKCWAIFVSPYANTNKVVHAYR